MNHAPLKIRRATRQDIPLIRDIAEKTWPEAFSNILSQGQISYMLNRMYHREVLSGEMKNHHLLYFLINDHQGFTSIEIDFDPEQKLAKIHKFYILPEFQRSGLGRKVMEFLAGLAREKEQKGLILNVNKYNSANRFYEKTGFEKWKSEVIDIGGGYMMDDYVLKKTL